MHVQVGGETSQEYMVQRHAMKAPFAHHRRIQDHRRIQSLGRAWSYPSAYQSGDSMLPHTALSCEQLGADYMVLDLPAVLYANSLIWPDYVFAD